MCLVIVHVKSLSLSLSLLHSLTLSLTHSLSLSLSLSPAQAVSGPKKEEHKERVLWASFEYGDLNDLSMGHLVPASRGSCSSQLPLILTLGFTSGFSLWMINVSSYICCVCVCVCQFITTSMHHTGCKINSRLVAICN